MLKKSVFFSFLNRRAGNSLDEYLKNSVEDEDFISWNNFVLPNDYGNSTEEYQAIRHSCALFDVSPMRKYRITGKDAGAFLDHLLTRPVSDASPMQGIYAAYCNDDGSLRDDSILYKYAEDDYLLMPSDMDHSEYFNSLQAKTGFSDLSISDCTESLAGMAVQGPLSATVLKEMGCEKIETLEPFQVRDFQLESSSKSISLRVARMGFTADLGYECWMETNLSAEFERCITTVRSTMKIDLPGYGLTALESCRLEGGYIVAGWDCATEADPNPGFERSPFELGIGWLVNLNAADFVGRDALIVEKEQGGRYVRRSFTLNSIIKPAESCEIWATIEDREICIGSVNCSAWSATMGKMIGNASILRNFREASQAWLTIDDQRQELELCMPPLLVFERSKQVPAIIFD